MNESNFYSAEYVNSILQENKSLEQVNVTLLNKLQTLEEKLESQTQSFETKDQQLKTKDESLNKAEQIIRKMQAEMENAKRNIDVNERQIKLLREQYKNLQVSYDKQERHLQDAENKRDLATDAKLEVKQVFSKMERMRRDHIFEFDVEKEKYQNLLHKNTDLERDYQTLQLSLEAKEQECFTIESHNAIQSQQINSLQNEISNMIDKLEDIKNSYESELESKDEQLQKNRNIALTQLRQMQQQMRQDSVNNQKEIMKLQEELQIKIQKRDNKREENKNLSKSDKKKKNNPLNTKRSSSNVRSSGLTTRFGKSTARSQSQNNIMSELLQPIKSQAEQDMFVNSPLISWMKQQLQDAWLREKQLKDFINQYSERCLVKLQIRQEDLEKQRGRVRAEVEMWQMRNEEMETRLFNANKKMWSIKQIAVEQQKQLKRQTVERQAIIQELEAYRNITQENILLCKSHYYDIYDQLRNAEGYQQIFHNLSVTKDNIDEADLDRAKLVKQLGTQIEVSARQRKTIQDQDEKIRIMEIEGVTMAEHFDQQADKTLCKIQNIFDVIDPETSRALVEPTIDQLINLIQGKIGKFHHFQKKEIRSSSPLRESRAHDILVRENYEVTIRDCHDKIGALESENAFLSSQVNAPLRGISSVQSMNAYPPELEAKLKNDAEMMALENRQLRCDISEKQIIIEELSQKNHRLQKDNKEARDKLFQSQSLFGESKDNRNNFPQNTGQTYQEMDSSFLNNQYASALRNPQNINTLSMSRNPPAPQEYPILFSNQSQNVKIDTDLEASQPVPETSKFGAVGNINALSQNMDFGNNKHNQAVFDNQQSQDALSNYIAQTASGPHTDQKQAPHNITLDTFQVQEAHKRHRDQLVVIQSIKEDIIDAVNDLKAKKDIWNISLQQEEKCDILIKKMVLNARESDHIAHSYDLVRGLFDILREVQKQKIGQSDKKQEIIEEIQEVKSDNENKVLKNIEIVIDVFKKAAEKIGKIGERDWREVLEQQGYVLEELISIQENLQKVGANHKGCKQAQVNFGHALSDFQFCLSKALDNLVCRDVDQDQRQLGTTSLRIKTKKLDDTELKRQITEVLAVSHKKLHSDASLQISHHMGLKGSQRLNSLLEIKQLSNKIMKSLREDLACSHSIYIKRMNADIIEFESNQRQSNEDMRRLPVEELIKIICLLKQDILSLRLNEIFMKKCSDQIKALKQSVTICNFESFFQAYQTQSQYELPQKLLKILNDMADSIQKEARGAFSIDQKQSSMIRTEFTEEILSIFQMQTQCIKDANNLSEILKLAY